MSLELRHPSYQWTIETMMHDFDVDNALVSNVPIDHPMEIRIRHTPLHTTALQ